MNYNDKEIDELIVSLMNKGFLSYIQCGDILVTSCENTYKKMNQLIIKLLILFHLILVLYNFVLRYFYNLYH